jgi:hypothetical protein
MSSARRDITITAVCVLIAGLMVLVLQRLYTPADRPAVVVPRVVKQKPLGVVYSAAFDSDNPGMEWSDTPVGATPKSHQKFLGPFLEVPLTFSVDGLGPHECVRVTFDLITHDPWNGDGGNFGRDLWDLRVVGGQPLIHTTFSNCGFFSNNNEQSFPDQYPWYPTHPGWTGTAAKQSLGYRNGWGAQSFGTDSTYHFDLTFPHSADTLALQFKSQIKRHEDKPYGFLNFKVETIAHAASASDESLAGLWKDLGDEDAAKAYRAVWSLIATGDSAAQYIQRHLPAAIPSVPLDIDQSKIWEYGSFQHDTPQARQFARAIHVLEVINSDSSKKLLTDMGYKGTPEGGPPTRWD